MPLLEPSVLKLFKTQGFIVVEGVLDTRDDLQPVVDEYTVLLDALTEQLCAAKKLTSAYRNLPFGHRLLQVVVETGRVYSQYFDISLPQADVTEQTPMHHGKAVFNLLRNPKLLDVVESLIGPEIYSNPVQHVRIKPPESVLPKDQLDVGLSSATYWHQDNAVILPEADESDILTVWLPITDATEENGCLQVVPGSHKSGLQTHCPSSDKGIHIPEKHLPRKPIPVPMKRGSALFMHRRTIHGSLRNVSKDIRWSFDLRYNPIGQPTGRPVLPGFIARSRAHPELALSDAKTWSKFWQEARSRIARNNHSVYTRWKTDAPICA